MFEILLETDMSDIGYDVFCYQTFQECLELGMATDQAKSSLTSSDGAVCSLGVCCPSRSNEIR